MTSYRLDIDVLRAFAVFAVVIFHSSINLLPNGYLGVDIFFVISGFIITRNLSENYLKNNKFSIINFYIRRIKRIFPLLFFVVTTTLLAVSFFYVTSLHAIFLTGGYSLFGISNIYFLFEENTNRYLQEIVRNPLNHTWSLGIEEQFYLIFPLVFALIIKFFKLRFINFAIMFFGLLTIIGLINSLFFINEINFFSSFYSPFTRFWEISAGSTIYFLTKSVKINPNFSYYLSYFLFLLLILFILFFSYLDIRYYQEIAIVVLLTSLLIFFLTFSTSIKFFKSKVLAYFGKLSFGIYLWHLPILFFLQLATDNDLLKIIFTLSAAIIFSFLSYKFIENPARYSIKYDKFLKRLIPISPLLFLVIFFNIQPSSNLFNYVVTKSEHLLTRNLSVTDTSILQNNTDINEFIYNNNSISACSEKQENLNFDKNYYLDNCLIKKNNGTLVHIMGDSTALAFAPMILNSSLKSDLIISSRSNVPFTPNLNSINDFTLPNKETIRLKEKFIENSINLNRIISNEYPSNIVIITSIYSDYMNRKQIVNENNVFINDDNRYKFFQDQLLKLVKKFDDSHSVIFIPDVFIPKLTLAECISLPIAINNNCHNPSIDDVIINRQKTIEAMKNIEVQFENVYIFDLQDTFCDEKCDYFYQENYAFSNDRYHITVEASSFLSKAFNDFLSFNNISP